MVKRVDPNQDTSVPSDVELADDIGAEMAEGFRALRQRIMHDHYHTVLLIGDSASGKSSTVTSLSILAQHCQGTLMLDFDEDFFENDNDAQKLIKTRSLQTYNEMRERWHSGVAQRQTRGPEGYYIPLNLRFNDGHRSVNQKLVFIDSQGESQRRRPSSKGYDSEAIDPKEYPPDDTAFPDNIGELLGSLTEPISLIHHAPAIGTPASQRANGRDFDKTLLSRMTSYTKQRRLSGLDNHLFLLSKWDEREDADINKANFAAPSLATVNSSLAGYPRSWEVFEKFANKSCLQYSSGHFDSNGNPSVINDPNDSRLRTINRYRKTLLNWILVGAGNEPVFEDVLPASKRTLPEIGRLERWLKRVLQP